MPVCRHRGTQEFADEFCPYGCTPLRQACHHHARGRLCTFQRCRFVHCEPGQNAEGRDLNSGRRTAWRNRNRNRDRTRSRDRTCSHDGKGRGNGGGSSSSNSAAGSAPGGRLTTEAESEALFRLGLRAEGLTQRQATKRYHEMMHVIHPDKAGPTFNNLSVQINGDYTLVTKMLTELGCAGL